VGLFEAQDAGEEDFLGPEPPPVGTLAYRRVILNICAAWTSDDYDAAMKPVFQWRGWRASVEVMCELIGAAGHNAPPSLVDAFGSVKLDSLVRVMDDEEILRQSHEFAPRTHPELPRHEALALSISEGEEMRATILDLLPVWNQAATMLRRAKTMQDVDPARALFTRWLNTHENRLNAAVIAAHTTHAYWRYRALPPGNEWIDEMLADGPDVRGSIAWARTATLADIARQQSDLVDNWVTRATVPKRSRKKHGVRCLGCGKVH
jgi:hypothetical protein